MMLLTCPNCGARNVSEFRYVGESKSRPDPETATPEQWRRYLYFHRNPAGWVGQVHALLDPLVAALGRYVLAGAKVHADDTPVKVLAPGEGKTRTARLWVYVRDDRPGGNTAPPAAWYRYTPDRKGEHPRRHLKHFAGILQADAYAGWGGLYDSGRVTEEGRVPRNSSACTADDASATAAASAIRQSVSFMQVSVSVRPRRTAPAPASRPRRAPAAWPRRCRDASAPCRNWWWE